MKKAQAKKVVVQNVCINKRNCQSVVFKKHNKVISASTAGWETIFVKKNKSGQFEATNKLNWIPMKFTAAYPDVAFANAAAVLWKL